MIATLAQQLRPLCITRYTYIGLCKNRFKPHVSSEFMDARTGDGSHSQGAVGELLRINVVTRKKRSFSFSSASSSSSTRLHWSSRFGALFPLLLLHLPLFFFPSHRMNFNGKGLFLRSLDFFICSNLNESILQFSVGLFIYLHWFLSPVSEARLFILLRGCNRRTSGLFSLRRCHYISRSISFF